MEFILLGCGTSSGVPLPGCSCRVCSSPNPRNYRNRTSALIKLDNGFHILIDAGPDLRQQAIAHRIPRVDAVLYTHAHADHILGTDDLRSFNFTSKQRIPCYGTDQTLRGIKRSFFYIFEPDGGYQGGLLAQLDLHEIPINSPFSIDTANFQPFPLTHGDIEVLGFRLGELGYATDFKTMSPAAKEILRGVKYLFIDGLRYEQHKTHTTIPEAIALVEEIGAKQAYIIHTSHAVEYEETNALLPPGIELGYDGLRVTFSDRS
jgi:phosphoribosyl 1,2-cyclic phosphate phosphodiesterase